MAFDELYIGNDNIVEVDSLRNVSTSPISYINDATVTATLYDTSGDEVSGETWPITLSYVGSSNGKYTGTITDTVTSGLSPNKRYRLRIQANGGAGLQAEWHRNYSAVRR